MKNKDRDSFRENLYYKDHISQIVHDAKEKGDFDNLPGKGKPLDLNKNPVNSYEGQLNKTLKDNNVIPAWIQLGNEIDSLKERLESCDPGEEKKIRKLINKKIKSYNWKCPPSLQKGLL
ncbi:DnaJ family domain-containing protein [Halobacillus faecis]